MAFLPAMALVMAAATAPARVNEAHKSAVVVCGVKTQVNPQTLRALQAKHIKPCAKPAPPAKRKLSPRKYSIAASRAAVASLAAKLRAKGHKLTVINTERLHGPTLHHINIASQPPPSIAQISIATVLPQNVPQTRAVQSAGGPNAATSGAGISIEGKNLWIAGQSPPTVTISFSDCRGVNQVPVILNGGDATSVYGVVGSWPDAFGNVQNFPGAGFSIPATLTVSNGPGLSASQAVTYVPQMVEEQDAVWVYYEPQMSFPNNAFMLPWDVAFANSGARESAFPAYVGGMGGKGDDSIATGVKLLNGWRVTSSAIVQAFSWNDPTDGSMFSVTDIPARGARVRSVAPGTITTDVHWWYDADQSISYEMEWQLMGPEQYRPLSTEKKMGGPCEQ